VSGSETSDGKVRVYRMRTSQRVVCLVLVAVGIFFTFAFWRGVLIGEREANFFELFGPVVYLLITAIFTIRAYKNAVLLTADSIELRGLSGRRALPIGKIRGLRRYLSKGDGESPDIWHIVLVRDDDRYNKLDIEELYNFDDVFYGWFKTLPDR
jgi:hypothetical protein